MDLDAVVMRRTIAALAGAASVGTLLMVTVMSGLSLRMLSFDAVVLIGGAGGALLAVRLPGAHGRARVGVLAGTLLAAIGAIAVDLFTGGGDAMSLLAALLGGAMALAASLIATDTAGWSAAREPD